MESGYNNPHDADFMITIGGGSRSIGIRFWDDDNVERGIFLTVTRSGGYLQVQFESAPEEHKSYSLYFGQAVRK